MASLNKDKKGKWRLRYSRDNRVREATFRANKLNAEKLKLIVEHRLEQIITGDANPQLAKWIKELPDSLREVLERHELVEQTRQRATVRELLDAFIETNSDVKPRTVANRRNAVNNVLRYFGEQRFIDTITRKNADDFYRWMQNESKIIGDGTALKPGTYLRRIKTVKMIFTLAMRYRWLEENPFEHLRGGNATDNSRFYFVTNDDAGRVYDACPNAFWRLVWVFTRWGGLRIRSEFPLLRWDGILWNENKITVFEPKKTRKNETLKTRFIPVFPELREALNEAWELSEAGDIYLADFYARMPRGEGIPRDGTWNPTTTLRKIILRAGITPWPKLLQNCRSTRETELASTYPIHDVTRWIGNSPTVALHHYLQSTDASFHHAASVPSALVSSSSVSASPETPDDLPQTSVNDRGKG